MKLALDEIPSRQDISNYMGLINEDSSKWQHALQLRWNRTTGMEQYPERTVSELHELVAREHGFEDWSSLENWVLSFKQRGNNEYNWLNSLMIGELEDWNYDQTTDLSLAERLVLAELSIDEIPIKPHEINHEIGPLSVPAIVYACCSSYRASDEKVSKARRELVKALLDLGADPSAGIRESTTIRGYLTCLGGAICLAKDTLLVLYLLDAGADVEDGPTLYEGSATWHAIEHQDIDSLTWLCEAKPPEWVLCHALTHNFSFNNTEITDMLLAYGANPNWTQTVLGMGGNALHEAIHCGLKPADVEGILNSGTNLEQTDHGDRTALTIARGYGLSDLPWLRDKLWVQRLADLGAEEDSLPVLETWVGAVVKHWDDIPAQIYEKLPASTDLSYHDHLWLFSAIKAGDANAVRELLNVLDVNTVDYEGDTPLHKSMKLKNIEISKVLLDAGARIDVTNFDGLTPVDIACRDLTETGLQLLDLLASLPYTYQFLAEGTFLKAEDEYLFEQAADAVVGGDLGTLQDTLEKKRYFAVARSKRAHKCTLLNYLGVNGFEGERQISPPNAAEVLECLVELGSDPNALCFTYRGGPGENAIGLLTSSDVIQDKAQLITLLRAFEKVGAKLKESNSLLFNLLDLKEQKKPIPSSLLETHSRDSLMETWLDLVQMGDLELIEALLHAGLDVNFSIFNQTALHWAAFFNKVDVVNFLLEHGANLDTVEDVFGGTPIGWADAGGHEELSKYLASKTKQK